MNELQTMADEYEEWKNTMPVNLAHGELADGLTDAVRQLHRAKDVLANINLPRGFGRSQIIAT